MTRPDAQDIRRQRPGNTIVRAIQELVHDIRQIRITSVDRNANHSKQTFSRDLTTSFPGLCARVFEDAESPVRQITQKSIKSPRNTAAAKMSISPSSFQKGKQLSFPAFIHFVHLITNAGPKAPGYRSSNEPFSATLSALYLIGMTRVVTRS